MLEFKLFFIIVRNSKTTKQKETYLALDWAGSESFAVTFSEDVDRENNSDHQALQRGNEDMGHEPSSV